MGQGGDWGLAGTSEHPKISLLKMMKFLIRMFTWEILWLKLFRWWLMRQTLEGKRIWPGWWTASGRIPPEWGRDWERSRWRCCTGPSGSRCSSSTGPPAGRRGRTPPGANYDGSPGFDDNEWRRKQKWWTMVRLMFENSCANSKHHLETQSMCLILEEHPRRKFKEFGRYHYC